MTGPTKILTVSYGTFSCTLEGFDDPLGSMREMAEYFRDLAADDRYFGAEPPTPDVEMLQRIAEKEVQRRVEARVTENGVALVAAEPPAAAPKAPEPQPQEQVTEPPAFDAETGPLAMDDEYLMADEPEDVLPADPTVRLSETGPAESVAEKLRRIRAVVSQNIAVDPAAAHREQTPNAEHPDLRDRALSETINQIQADLADDEDAPAPQRDRADEEDIDPEPVEPVAEASETPEPEGAADVAAEASRADPEAVTSEAPTVDQPEEAPAVEEDQGGDVDTSDVPDSDDEEIETAESIQRSASVSEMIGSVTERIKAEVSAEAAPAAPTPRTATRLLSPEPEADVGRLLSETDTKLNDDETVRRRRVISQMRAAVAATKADRLVTQHVTREEQEEAEQDPYREDLSEAVEVSDAVSEIVQLESKRIASAPPLVLVSSQRIDAEIQVEGHDAAEFAAKFGAKELPELMEAAAAYAIFSEGQPSFTRPEIMQMVTRMDPSLTLSREESLRSFGQLLREGTFKKLERGQFTIDQATKYNPEASAAGL